MTEDDFTKIATTLDNDTVWLSIDQMTVWENSQYYYIMLQNLYIQYFQWIAGFFYALMKRLMYRLKMAVDSFLHYNTIE